VKIPLMNLEAQYFSLKDEIDDAIYEVMWNCQFILGGKVQCLEEAIADYCKVKYAVGVANGTDALILSLEALGIGPGDEVITTPFTFFATAESISRVGAKPVFVDIRPDTFNIDENLIEEKITKKTKAIMPVHLFGQPADMGTIMDVAQRYNLKVIEDACQAMGASIGGMMTGGIGDVGCFSFFPSKNLGGIGDGGTVATDDEKIANKVRLLARHGSSQRDCYQMIGRNSRLDTIQATVLLVKLRRLDVWNGMRRKNAYYYNHFLRDANVVTPFEEKNLKHVYHLYNIRTKNRTQLIRTLNEKGISVGKYYSHPLHLQEAYVDLGYKLGDLPESEKAAKEILALPMYPELSRKQIEYVADAIKEVR